MKRTTYILIGILVLGLLVLLAFVFYASVAGNKPKEDKELFPESVSMDATGVHTVKFRPIRRMCTSHCWADCG